MLGYNSTNHRIDFWVARKHKIIHDVETIITPIVLGRVCQTFINLQCQFNKIVNNHSAFNISKTLKLLSELINKTFRCESTPKKHFHMLPGSRFVF